MADPDASREKRLSQIESNLKALLDEVRTLREEGDRKHGGGSGAAPNPSLQRK